MDVSAAHAATVVVLQEFGILIRCCCMKEVLLELSLCSSYGRLNCERDEICVM